MRAGKYIPRMSGCYFWKRDGATYEIVYIKRQNDGVEGQPNEHDLVGFRWGSNNVFDLQWFFDFGTFLGPVSESIVGQYEPPQSLPTTIVPNTTLARLIDAARNYKLTPEEMFEQRVSFVYGQLPKENKMTKEEVRELLKEGGV